MEQFNQSDLHQIKNRNLTPEDINRQIEHFKKGFPFIKLDRPATVNDGIFAFSEKDIDQLTDFYDEEQKKYDIIKFVPASGAATRMFKELYSFMQDFTGSENQLEELEKQQNFHSVKYFFDHLHDFAFFDALKRIMRESGYDIEDQYRQKHYKVILEYLLTERGLNYANKPKALLLFHKYENSARMAMEEHLIEGVHYVQNAKGKVQIHFTVSPEHQEEFSHEIEQRKIKHESEFRVQFEVSFSQQKPSTDIIAVTPDNEPFRNEDGALLFRPGGHGALIENLNELENDIVFIKNIDNVVPDRLKDSTYRYKKLIGGYLLRIKAKVDEYMELLDEGSATNEELEEMRDFADNYLNIHNNPKAFKKKEHIEKVDLLYNQLNRPIRVCGMVKNEGEPGGGPFWVKEPSGNKTLQIVEKAQINFDDPQQADIVSQSTHFNPVDLVCALNDFKGEKFDLKEFVDTNTGFISEKYKEGKPLKAQELPGLWNGAMAGWITIFVEVPIITFNPVKVINDLLRENHQ
ncbi:MAG: DUF4301 family protein [Bacteroidales bacterium]|nr:DUF4301 family protein [Bacteroidales bacterium]